MTGEILEACRVQRLSDSPSILKTDLWMSRADCTSAVALRCLHFHCHTSEHQPGRAGALWEPEGDEREKQQPAGKHRWLPGGGWKMGVEITGQGVME